jgi:hypothetical protein
VYSFFVLVLYVRAFQLTFLKKKWIPMPRLVALVSRFKIASVGSKLYFMVAQLKKGQAEIFGAELAIMQTITTWGQKFAVGTLFCRATHPECEGLPMHVDLDRLLLQIFTWDGCTVELSTDFGTLDQAANMMWVLHLTCPETCFLTGGNLSVIDQKWGLGAPRLLTTCVLVFEF